MLFRSQRLRGGDDLLRQVLAEVVALPQLLDQHHQAPALAAVELGKAVGDVGQLVLCVHGLGFRR